MEKDELKGVTFNAPVSIGTFVKVEKGATYIKNNFPNVSKYNEAEDERQETEEAMKSNLEIALQAIAGMAMDGTFKPQKYYIAAYRLVEELYANGMETAEFCRLMEKKSSLPADLLPKNDNIRKIYFEKKLRYPNWSFPEEGTEFSQSMVDIATELIERIKRSK